MSFEEHLRLAERDFDLQFPLKLEQTEALKSLYDQKDTFCMLRTGFGKSLIFQLSPFVLGRKIGSEDTITLVISPLNSIMTDQVKKLCSRGIPACSLDMQCTSGESYKFESMDDVEGGCLAVVFLMQIDLFLFVCFLMQIEFL